MHRKYIRVHKVSSDSQEWWCTSLTLAAAESLSAETREAADSVHARAAVEAASVH